jgi:hypothetical protein
VTSVPDITRMIARIEDGRDGHGKPGGRGEAAQRLDEAHKLFDEISNMLTEMRRELLGSGRQRRPTNQFLPEILPRSVHRVAALVMVSSTSLSSGSAAPHVLD